MGRRKPEGRVMVGVWLSAEEHERLRLLALAAKLPLASYLREHALGARIATVTLSVRAAPSDGALIEEARRAAGLNHAAVPAAVRSPYLLWNGQTASGSPPFSSSFPRFPPLYDESGEP